MHFITDYYESDESALGPDAPTPDPECWASASEEELIGCSLDHGNNLVSALERINRWATEGAFKTCRVLAIDERDGELVAIFDRQGRAKDSGGRDTSFWPEHLRTDESLKSPDAPWQEEPWGLGDGKMVFPSAQKQVLAWANSERKSTFKTARTAWVVGTRRSGGVIGYFDWHGTFVGTDEANDQFETKGKVGMFEVRREDLKTMQVFDPADFDKGVREALEAAELMGAHLSNEDPDNCYAVMTRITVVDKFPELRVLSIWEYGDQFWKTDKYDAELLGALS